MAMRQCAVVLMDALGFKGIWKTHSAEHVLSSMKYLSAESRREAEATEGAWENPDNLIEWFKVAVISDTVFMAMSGKATGRFSPTEVVHETIGLLSGFASLYLQRALGTTPAFLFRGAISFGEVAHEDNFFVGRAVDEAAEYMNLAQGAFLYLAPSALRALASDREPPGYAFDVPLKAGGAFETRCIVPPDCFGGSTAARASAMGNFERAFGDTSQIDVQLKRQNTMRFLKHLDETSLRLEREHSARRRALGYE
jgi:hypothetical protein